jgi:Dyp-type peroxidase family
MPSTLDAAQVQGNVLYAYGTSYPHAHYRLLRITDLHAAAPTLRRWLAEVTFGERPKDEPDRARPHVNLAFTFAGLEALELRQPDLLHAFAEDFRAGAASRTRKLGDTWQKPGALENHLLLSVHAGSVAERQTSLDCLFRDAPGLAVTHPRDTDLIDRGESEAVRYHREHFGFADGGAQPAIEGVHAMPQGGGVYAGIPVKGWPPLRVAATIAEDVGLKPIKREWRPIKAGEFVLGYDNEDGRPPPAPPAPLGPNGTFMVYREIEQFVGRFNAHIATCVEELAAKPWVRDLPVNARADGVKAKIVGRWPDGTPLVLSPRAPQPLIADSAQRANNFLYWDLPPYDRNGGRCPLGAHIRRSNPRDALPGGDERTMRHRIIRRGMPYGPPYDAEPDAERGLAFVCFGASIESGFEFIQGNWLNDGDAFGLGLQPDYLLQTDGTWPMVVQEADGDFSVLPAPKEPFVEVKRCEYLFVPSRQACEWLSRALESH